MTSVTVTPYQATIETERLTMRPYILEDLENSVALYGDPAVTEKFDEGVPKSREAVAKLVHDIGINRFQKQDPCGLFSVFKKDTQEFVGQFDFLPDEENGEHVEIGYIIHTRYQRQGYGTEISKSLIDYAKKINQLGLRKITALTATARPDNIGSWKVLEKMGMTMVKEGERFGASRHWYKLDL
jgi:RimJ/RimL family protein N-acetyltransferase